jgi:HAD-superfamily hydrolase, subfamily IIB
MYTHIVIDLDGTLLGKNHEIMPITKRALLHIQKELGMKLILASGRPVPFMEPIARSLEMDQYGGFLISNNGAAVYDCAKSEYVFENKLEAEEIIEIVKQTSTFDVIPLVHYGEHLYVEAHHHGIVKRVDSDMNIIEGELNSGNFKLKQVEKLVDSIDFPAYKVLVAGDSDYINENQDLIRGDLKDKYTGLVTGPVALEFTKQGVDKAFSLAWLAEAEGFSKNTVMAFGDGQNDITLFEYANHGVAMGNAVSELIEIADAVTLSHLEDGIGVYLNNFFALELTV